ncbi:PKD domain-containing protein [Candidatus Bipolaricaulota bacterium]|nr:PKD domain-containing protein [Candidatus Bipolaricaulota bacterium]
MKSLVKYGTLVILFSVLLLSLNGCNSNKKPTASFSANPGSGGAPLNVTLDASNSADEDGIVDNFSWEFGDGTTGGGRIVEHTFSSPGEYTITLTVTDNDGATAEATNTVTVEESPPTAKITAEPQEGEAPVNVTFDLSNSSDPDGVIEEYSLEFGDGETTSGTDLLNVIEHEYSTDGEYEVTLEVTDDNGLSSTTTKTINVQKPPPENKLPSASISVDSQSGTAPLTVNFSAGDSSDPDGELVGYVWQFGDGESSSGENVSHKYDSAGNFTAKLTVTDNRDGTATAETEITVDPATYYVGESAGNGSVRITLQDATMKEAIADWQSEAGRQFVIVEVTVRALKDDQYPSKSLNFKLEESNGRTQSVSLATSALENYFSSNILNQGDMSRGKMAFEARKSSEYYHLIYNAPNQSPIQFEIPNQN